MKKLLAKLITNSIIGIGFGSFSYLIFLLFKLQSTFPSTKNILSIWIMSALIGCLSELFDYFGLSLLTLILHLGGTITLVLAMTTFNGWFNNFITSPLYWSAFLGIYLLVWLVLFTIQHLTVKKINQKLIQRNSPLK